MDHHTDPFERMLDRTEQELKEADAEIARHHRDFEEIRRLLDSAKQQKSPVVSQEEWSAFLRSLRNVVG